MTPISPLKATDEGIELGMNYRCFIENFNISMLALGDVDLWEDIA